MSWSIRRVERRVSSDRRHGFQRRSADRDSPLMLMPAVHLTKREREIRELIALGLGNKEIAGRLAISDHTAKFHVSQILAKLNAVSRAEAVSIAMRRGLVPL